MFKILFRWVLGCRVALFLGSLRTVQQLIEVRHTSICLKKMILLSCFEYLYQFCVCCVCFCNIPSRVRCDGMLRSSGQVLFVTSQLRWQCVITWDELNNVKKKMTFRVCLKNSNPPQRSAILPVLSGKSCAAVAARWEMSQIKSCVKGCVSWF